MSDTFVLVADLLTKIQTSKLASSLTQPDKPSELWNATESEAIKSVEIIPTVESIWPEFSQLTSSATAFRSQKASWVAAVTEPELPPLAEASKYLPPLPQEQSFVRYSSESSAGYVSDIPRSKLSGVRPEISRDAIAFSRSTGRRPVSGSQMYNQRLAALRSGQTYTRLPADSFWSSWENSTEQPTYEDWRSLLEGEASAIARGQGSNRLGILVGDSISMWFPCDRLPVGSLWLNQGISGDTTGGILNRLFAFSETRPDTIYLLAGINDLRRGASNEEILYNLDEIILRLRQEHPQAQIIVQSILPTRLATIPNSRIRNINQQLAAIAPQHGAAYLDLYSYFTDVDGNLRRELTTDGLHLNPRGYGVWQLALRRSESWIAQTRFTSDANEGYSAGLVQSYPQPYK